MTRDVIISGLRRSGTTIFWEILRSHPGVLAIDEPFHPKLVEGDRENKKGTWPELKQILVPEGQINPVAISAVEELESEMGQSRVDYFRDVLGSHESVVTDVVRCWNMASDLRATSDDAVFVHLLRGVKGWVQAQLMPTGPKSFKKRVADFYRRVSFFSRRGFFDNYHYQTIIREALDANHPMWRFSEMRVDELKRAPAYTQLMAFWWCANLETFQAANLSNGRAILVNLEEFSATPGQIVDQVTQLAQLPAHRYPIEQVRRVRVPFKSGSGHWKRAAESIGIPLCLLSDDAQSADTLSDAFKAAIERAKQ